MGFYYENGQQFGKAESLIKEHGATIIGPLRARRALEEGDTAVVCVFQNPHFDAAAYCYDMKEFDRLNFNSQEDPRVKTLLEVPNKAFIEQVTGFDKSGISVERKKHLYN